MEEPLTILYTANLRGSLERLPRLHTFLRGLKNLPPADEPDVLLCAVEPVARRILLLDAGNACAPEVWHCAATGGRSTLIVLDAMGYHAANVSESLTAESRARLDANYLGMALVDESHPWQSGTITVICGAGATPPPAPLPAMQGGGESSFPLPNGDGSLRIVLSPNDAFVGAHSRAPLSENQPGLRPSPAGYNLDLPPVEALQVGVIHVAWANHVPVIRARSVLDMPPGTPPDPTITAAVEFVLSEARRYQSP